MPSSATLNETKLVAPTKNSRAGFINGERSSAQAVSRDGCLVNDVHSQLNPTRVSHINRPSSTEQLQCFVRTARKYGRAVCVAGGRHAMGGQQFATNAVLLDMSGMNRVWHLDYESHAVDVEAGINWTELVAHLSQAQVAREHPLSIIQKQTGADRLSIGGALAANIHGRGLQLKPIIEDVESFELIDANGERRLCSREENADLFRLAIGGYGLFGIIARVRLRLTERRKLRRVVELRDTRDVISAFEQHIADGALYGDFQFMTDERAENFLRRGIFSCYSLADDATPMPPVQCELSAADWRKLCWLAHTDRAQAFELYAAHYLSTSDQLYWSDTHQLSVYLDDYHDELNKHLGAIGSEMITELYVPRNRLSDFMEIVRRDFLRHRAELIYGTVRLIEKDDESFLAWAREAFACVVFNLHVSHTRAGIAKARADFRRLIDRAIQYGGSYYLTYHRWARCAQLLSCYPQFPAFLKLKIKHDPVEIFQSEWYRAHQSSLAGFAR